MKAEKSIDALTDEVEELLALLELHPSPDLDALRTRVADALRSARTAMARSKARARVKRYVGSIDHYVTTYPRLGFISGALLGGSIMYAAGLLRTRD